MKHLLFLWGVMALVLYFSVKDWFIALCGLIVYTAISEYPEFPTLTDVNGVNYWSVMALAVLISWLVMRRGALNIPRGWAIVLTAYVVIEIIAVTRTVVDIEVFGERASQASGNLAYASYTVKGFFIDYIYVPGKFMLLGFLLLDGARTSRRQFLGICAVVLTATAYGLLIIKTMPIESLRATGEELLKFRHRIGRDTGVHPNDLAVYLSVGFWSALALHQYAKGNRWLRWAALGAVLATFFGLLYTHSRGGYVGFVGTGLLLCLLRRWWKFLGGMVVLVVAVAIVFPSVPQRMLSGVGVETASGRRDNDFAEITAGRSTTIWPAAVRGISESPLLGHGHFGYVMSSAVEYSVQEGGGELHPHCAYLEVLLDVGILGAIAVMAPLIYTLVVSCILIRGRPADSLSALVGSAGLAASLTMLIQGASGQHFVMHENMFLYWCVAGLVARAGSVREIRFARLEVRKPVTGWSQHARPARRGNA